MPQLRCSLCGQTVTVTILSERVHLRLDVEDSSLSSRRLVGGKEDNPAGLRRRTPMRRQVRAVDPTAPGKQVADFRHGAMHDRVAGSKILLTR